MSALARGYPGMRRNAVDPLDIQSGSRGTPKALRAANVQYVRANDNFPFLQEREVRQFGRRKATNVVARRAAGAVAGRAIGLLSGPLSLAVAGYEVYQWVTEGGELPRDWSVAEDRALTFPANWSVSAVADNPPVFVDGYRDEAAPRWFRQAVVTPSVQTVETAVPPWDQQDTQVAAGDIIETDPSGLVAGPNPTGRIFNEQWHYDASADYAGNSIGTRAEVQFYKTAAGAEPSFANPPRVAAPTVTTVAVPVPAPAPAPFRRASDPLENPYTERGEPSPLPAAPPVPLVPPTFVVQPPRLPELGDDEGAVAPVSGPRPGRNPRPRPGPRPGDRPRPEDGRPRSRPDNRTKERKVNLKDKWGRALALLHAAVGQTTEYMDMINALYNALPNEFKPGYVKLHYRDKATGEVKTYYKRRWKPDWSERQAAVWKHYNEIDIHKAIRNMLEQNALDTAIGHQARVGRNAARAARQRSWQLGEWDTAASKQAWDYRERERIKREREARDRDLHEKRVRAARRGLFGG